MSTVTTVSKPTAKSIIERTRSWLSPLNLHFAGVGLLVLVNVYLLVHMAIRWQAVSRNDAEAVAEQRIALKTAEVAAQPLRGLDTKLERSTADADRFYRERLPGAGSEVLSELGELTKKQNVRLTRLQNLYAPILPGSVGELTEIRMDASLGGDYRPLMQVINSLERDKMFFVIDAVTLTGQQSGTVNLRLRLRTYLRGHIPPDETQNPNSAAGSAADTAATPADIIPGGSGR